METAIRFRPTRNKEELPLLTTWFSHPSNAMGYVPNEKIEYECSAMLWMQHAQYSGLTVLIDDKPVAFGLLQLELFNRIRHTAELSIIVDPKKTGQQIGTALVEELCKFGKKVFSLEKVHIQVHSGSRAYNFYKSLGFKEFGRQKNWIKEKDCPYRSRIFMEKEL